MSNNKIDKERQNVFIAVDYTFDHNLNAAKFAALKVSGENFPGNLSFDKLQSKIPILIVIGDLPTYKGDKKKVTVSYTDPFNSSFNYEDSATIDVQGTSSQWSKFWLPY